MAISVGLKSDGFPNLKSISMSSSESVREEPREAPRETREARREARGEPAREERSGPARKESAPQMSAPTGEEVTHSERHCPEYL